MNLVWNFFICKCFNCLLEIDVRLEVVIFILDFGGSFINNFFKISDYSKVLDNKVYKDKREYDRISRSRITVIVDIIIIR